MKVFLAVLVMFNIYGGVATLPNAVSALSNIISSIKTYVSDLGADSADMKRDIAALQNTPVTVGQLKSKPIVTKRRLQPGPIHDLAVTSSGHIGVASAGGGAKSKIYDSDYSLIKDMNKNKHFLYITATRDNQLVFADGSNKLYFYTADGNRIRKIRVEGYGMIRGITALSTGQLVVCDANTDNVYIVDQHTGNATQLSASGTFHYPRYVTTNSKGVIVVSDRYSHSVRGLNETGDELFSYGTSGSGEGQLYYPGGVFTDSEDYVVVADGNNNRVHLLTPEGNFHSYLLTESDGVYHPLGVGMNQDGQILVGDDKGQLFTITYRE